MIKLLRQMTREVEDGNFDCIVGTLPKIDSSMLLEDYLQIASENLDELARLTNAKGTIWLRVIDSYNYIGAMPGVSHKTLLGIPQRIASLAIDKGLILRNTIYWHKPNMVISQMSDRFPVDVDTILMLNLSDDYYFRQQYEHRDNYITAISNKTQSKPVEKVANSKEIQTISKIKQSFVTSLRPYTGDREEDLTKEFGYVWKKWLTPITIDLPTTAEWKKLQHILGYPGPDLIHPRIKLNDETCLVRTGRSKRTVWYGDTASDNVMPVSMLTTMVEATCVPCGKVFDPFGSESNLSYVVNKRDRKFFSIFEINGDA